MHKFALRIDPLRSPCLFIAYTTCGEKLDNLVVDSFLTISVECNVYYVDVILV